MSRSDGSSADYYVLPEGATQLQDLISHRDMNSQIGEIFRACYRYGIVSHSDKMRDAKKIRFYAQAEVERLEKLSAAQNTGGPIPANAMYIVGDQPSECLVPSHIISDIPGYEDWKKGDLVEALEGAIGIKEGDTYMLKRDADESGDIHFDDDDGDARNRQAKNYRFVLRP
jgi:hypothetical protein